MMPSEEAIARVMAETGMGEMQAVNHLRGRKAVQELLARRRRFD